MTRKDYIAIGITILLVCLVLFVEHRPIVYPRNTIEEQKEYNAKWGVDDYRDGSACPICKRDSVDTLKYGYVHGQCVVSRKSKQYRCKVCGYSWGLLYFFKKNEGRPFNEQTIEDDGKYIIDVDFDGANDNLFVKNGTVRVCRLDTTTDNYKNVSKHVPYCFLAAHLCCEAHKAFTTFNYSAKTIYIEAHYGSGDVNTNIRQFQKVGDEWKEVIPIKPSNIINKDLYPPQHLFIQFHSSMHHWSWGNGRGGLYYWAR